MFLLKKLLPYLAALLVVVAGAFGLMKWGEEKAKREVLEQTIEDIKDTSKGIQRGLNEIRKENPTGDAATALDRLRQRQANR